MTLINLKKAADMLDYELETMQAYLYSERLKNTPRGKLINSLKVHRGKNRVLFFERQEVEALKEKFYTKNNKTEYKNFTPKQRDILTDYFLEVLSNG